MRWVPDISELRLSWYHDAIRGGPAVRACLFRTSVRSKPQEGVSHKEPHTVHSTNVISRRQFLAALSFRKSAVRAADTVRAFCFPSARQLLT
jgi:hypothetical protein